MPISMGKRQCLIREREKVSEGGFKPGMRVQILRRDIAFMKHRKNRNGWVVDVNGAYIYVRPMWAVKDCLLELYPNELRKLP